MTKSSMFAIFWRLRRLGYRNVYALNHRPFFGPLEAMGERLVPEIREIARLAEGQPVVCIGHCIGGLVLRWCLQRDPNLPVAKVITVATPHRGTRLAVFGINTATRQARPDSAFLASLEPESRVPLTSIYSRLDRIVIPPESATFGTHSLDFNDCGHLTLIFDPRPFEWIAAELPALPNANNADSGARAQRSADTEVS